MPTAFQLRTFPELLAQMMATARTQLGETIDLNVGSILRAIYEACALVDAEQYVQIAKLLDLFALDKAKDDDLDRRALDFGAAVFTDLLRKKAQTSVSEVVVGDGSLQAKSKLVADLVATATSFSVTDGSSFPISGALVLERATSREEEITYTRSGDVFTVIFPTTGLRNPHVINGVVETIAIRSLTSALVPAGAISFNLQAGTETAWPGSGSVIFERDTVRREIRTFTRIGTLMTLGAVTTFQHGAGTDVTLSTFGSDRAIAAGLPCYVPETAASKRVLFRTNESGVLLDGDYVSALVSVESEVPGVQTLVGAGQINKWQTEPFANATVLNPNAAVRGRDRESDEEYVARIRAFVQSLSRATALAIETLVAGKRDPFSNLIVAFAQTVEPVAPGEALLYITDGSTTFTIDSQVFLGRDVLISDARVGDKRARLHQFAPFSETANPVGSRTPRIFKSTERGVATSVGTNFLEDTTQAWGVNALVGYWLKTDDDQFYQITSNTAIRVNVSAGGATPSLGSYSIFNFGADPLEPGVDYIFNKSNGDLELTVALVAHDGLVAADDGASSSVGAYTYSRGLAAYAQRLVNGDRSAFEDFPGIKALGTQCRVVVPTIIIPTIVIQVVTDSGLTDEDLRATVQGIVQAYVNALGIGQPVLLSEIVRLVKGLQGVRDCKVISPTANIIVPDGQLARINTSDVQVV